VSSHEEQYAIVKKHCYDQVSVKQVAKIREEMNTPTEQEQLLQIIEPEFIAYEVNAKLRKQLAAEQEKVIALEGVINTRAEQMTLEHNRR
jgi:hypothetical protein